MTLERRNHRSDVPAEAARLYLDTAVRSHGYASLTLADADGLVVVDAPSAINSEAVAAVAPFVEDGGPGGTEGLVEMVTRGQPLRVRGFHMDGQRLFLAAVGGDEQPGPSAEAAMRRILGAESAVA